MYQLLSKRSKFSLRNCVEKRAPSSYYRTVHIFSEAHTDARPTKIVPQTHLHSYNILSVITHIYRKYKIPLTMHSDNYYMSIFHRHCVRLGLFHSVDEVFWERYLQCLKQRNIHLRCLLTQVKRSVNNLIYSQHGIYLRQHNHILHQSNLTAYK